MDETYRMLGKLHEADLEREAQKRRLADLAVEPPRNVARRENKRTRRLRLLLRVKEA